MIGLGRRSVPRWISAKKTFFSMKNPNCSRKKWICHWKIGIFWPKSPGDPSDDLGRSFGIIFSSKFQHPTMLVYHSHDHSHVFLENYFFRKTWKSNFSGIPWTPGPSGPPLCSRAPNSIQDSLNESSVGPNGTPVMPVLRSKSTVKKTVRKKHGLVVKKTPSG